jgi:fluoride exporter
MKSSLIVFLGAGLGGTLRHLFNVGVGTLYGGGFPLGILLINVIGSTVMGLVVGWFAFRGAAPADLRMFLTTGLLGGFTTFSAFSFDAAFLYERGQPGLAVFYVVASVGLSIAGLFLALWAVRAITA